MCEAEIPQLITIGRLAELLDTTPERVARVIRARRHIKPAARAGNVRLFGSEAVELLRVEFAKIDARHAKTMRILGNAE